MGYTDDIKEINERFEVYTGTDSERKMARHIYNLETRLYGPKTQVVGIVTFDGGNIGYVAETIERLYSTIAHTFVANWCKDDDSESVILDLIANQQYQQACSIYFEEHHTDSLDVATV